MNKYPLVSVIIVNYNAQAWLTKCLASIAKNTYPNYEVIVVDNGSETFTPLPPLPPFTPKVIRLSRNFGPAYARNRAAEKARGKYLALLDNDTQVHKDWLTKAVKIMEGDETAGALQCKLLLNKARNRFDYAGDYLTQWGFLTQVIEANVKDTNQVPEGLEILAAKSAGMIIRKDTFDTIGGFDENYFMFMEETDLSWRVWLSGKNVTFTNQSVVYHEFGTSSMLDPRLGQKNAKYHGTKNYITTMIKNLEAVNLLKILPLHLALWLAMSAFLFLKGKPRESFYVFRGILYNFISLPRLLRQRKLVQKTRQASDTTLFPKIFRRVPFSYFYKKLTQSKPLGNAKPFYLGKQDGGTASQAIFQSAEK